MKNFEKVGHLNRQCQKSSGFTVILSKHRIFKGISWWIWRMEGILQVSGIQSVVVAVSLFFPMYHQSQDKVLKQSAKKKMRMSIRDTFYTFSGSKVHLDTPFLSF
jgi:hypothetical protein